ncbi:RHS repeat-associated core domain-containing protein [Chitinophaga filiformis]|uniref:RHS repeat-associated core domain-containing protein n=2 Tax=Chitinophaga filiformis TaxID=104663 RepID=A0A1G8CCH7_CHIFI|nr:RHS repeat-associated core domain-containing protein [Chitinophaga filiformis]
MRPFLLSLNHMKSLVLACLLLMMAIAGQAQSMISLKQTLSGSRGQIAKDSVATVTDSLYFNPAILNSLDTPYKVRNIITFKINEYVAINLPPTFTADVAIRIIYTRPDLQLDSVDRTLSINYVDTSTYRSKSSFVFNNAHQVTVRVLSLTTTGTTDFKPALALDNEMQVYPVYKLSCTDNAVKSFTSIQLSEFNDADELMVSWPTVIGADVYDLEWAYIDSSALRVNRYGNPINTALIFKNNASRVTVRGGSYNIPLLYDQEGALYCRVRAVQEREHNVRIETAWSSAFPGGLGSYSYGGHQVALNWQATTSFAEEGKRKSVVQYYDGSLRSRQTVTKDNSTNTTIVGETFYDYQGRPTIQVMPSPTLSGIIKYSPGFNTGINSPEYDKGQYDTLPSPANFLTASAKPMSTASGANQYYSPNNPDTSDFNKFIPDAEGYAFTETVYTQDNTGRISRQGGVGPVFRIGSNHETEYYYGSPGVNDLDALFGTDAGDRTHYFKNMVQDANGQYAVSYVDMHGRTVATALAGRPDSASLSDLSSYSEQSVTDTLSTRNSNIIKDLTLENRQSQLVAIDGDYTFNYQLKAPAIKLNGCQGQICFNGLYDLEIKITDDAYNQRLGGKPFDTVFHNYNLDSIKADCSIQPRDFNVSFTVHLLKGNYEITKQLTINREALEYYRDSIFLKQNTCITLDQFIQQQRSLLATAQCVPDCKSCRDSIGTWAQFWAKYPALIGQAVGDSALYKAQALSDYNEAVENCDALCNSTSDATDIRKAMLLDVTAPSGQYANPDDSTNIYSIFYHKDLGYLPPYRRDTVYYMNEAGLPDMVYDDEVQAYVKPQQLSPKAFAAKFKDSWAEALLKFHPEYYKYLAFLKHKPSYDWDRKMEAVDDYVTARDSGYLNPVADTNFIFTAVQANKDPLAAENSLWNTRLSQILTSYNNQIAPGSNLSLWSVATLSVKCKDAVKDCFDTYSTPAMAFNESLLCTGDLDMAWRSFRQSYLAAKHNLLDADIYNVGAPAGYAMVTAEQLIAIGKYPRFNTAAAALSQNGLGYLSTNKTQKELTDSLNKALDTAYAQNCNAYVSTWMQQLAPCKYDSTAWKQIKIKLLEVCKQGSDVDHPLGSSSVKPSSSYKYKSFQDVLNEYNAANHIDSPWTCNAYLITAPAPYDKQPAYGDKKTYTGPTDCECNQLRTLQTEYNVRKNSSDSTLASYLNRTRGTALLQSDLQVLLDACSASGGSCTYLSQPVEIPVLMQCNVAPACVSCTEVKQAYDAFKAKFPGVTPMEQETDSLQQLKNQLFAAYMNNRLGFGKQAWEYLVFMDTCALYTTKDSTVCKTGNKLYHTYEEWLGRSVVIADIVSTPDNGYLLAGSLKGMVDTTSDSTIYTSRVSDTSNLSVGPVTPVVQRDSLALLLKVNQYGDVQWAKHYGFGSDNYFTKVRTTREGGYVAIGSVQSVGRDSSAVLIVKTNGSGSVQWSRKIGLSTANGETGWDIIQTSDGGYAFAGRTNTNYVDSTGDWLVGAIDANGYGRWLKQLGNGSIDEVYSMFEDHDTLVVLGSTFLVHSGGWRDYDVVIAKLNKNTGVTSKTFRYDFGSAPGTNNNYPNIVQKTTYGFLFNVTNGVGKSARSGIVGVTNNGDILTSRQLSSPLDTIIAQGMPMIGSANGILAIQNVLTQPKNIFAFNKINTDTTLAWSDLIRLDSSSFLNDVLERPDGGYVAGGTYGTRGLLVYTPVSGRLTCGKSTLNSTFTTLRGTPNKNSPMGIDMARNIDSALLPVTIQPVDLSIYEVGIGCYDSDSCYKIRGGPLLCGNSNAIFRGYTDSTNNCSDNEYFAVSKGTELYNAYVDSLKTSFGNTYADSCMQAGQKEAYTLTYNISEYHYTLYYYDQAGNLVKTVPPAGVVVDRSASWASRVRAARAAGTDLTPAHTMVTKYRYNTLNQVVAQRTPDAGDSKFWYDRLGRLAVSQNAKQQPLAAYSYTQYDPLGRITEVGEISSSTAMDNALSRSPGSLAGWFTNSANSRTQITVTTYDIANSFIAGYLSPVNLRNRVAWTALYDSAPEQIAGGYAAATFYSYDIHGNVDTLLQDYKKGSMAAASNRFKKIVYRYDLISGKVNHVAYQPGMPDAFYHRYSYDAENRLTNVETSSDSVYWENDAFYQYYKHGPLARAVIGQQQVQGMDYAYTLQGWLKGVNSTAVGTGFDMGHDGSGTGRDVFGFALHYYGDRDYKPLSQGLNPFAPVGNTGFKPLFNGNIGAISQSIPSLGTPLQYAYNYDVLNRLKGMQVSRGLDSLANKWTPVNLPDFKEDISYDPNGNILNYNRAGNNTFAGKQLPMDSLTYKYTDGTNRLSYVQDAVSSSKYDVDIDNQLKDNYQYDGIGNLIRDSVAGITAIDWTVYGKIKSINKNGTLINYTYDVAGNRISKSVNGVETWYVRDATGNVMAVYENGNPGVNGGKLSRSETHLYGSSRLGVNSLVTNLEDAQPSTAVNLPGLDSGININFIRGNKVFELSNHLGNVLATVSDKRRLQSGSWFKADVRSAQEYYPFGMMMVGRSFNAGGYRYGFNGKENDNEVKGEGNQQDYGMRVYDPRLGKFLSVDPLTKQYPWYTPYQFAGNKPIWAIDLDGAEEDFPGSPGYMGTKIGRETAFGIKKGFRNAQLFVRQLFGDIKEGQKIRAVIVRDDYDLPYKLEDVDVSERTTSEKIWATVDDVVSIASVYTGRSIAPGAAPMMAQAKGMAGWAKGVLKMSDGFFHTRTGLKLGQGSVHLNRFTHYLAHAVDDLTKMKHGVFQLGKNETVVGLLDDAWKMVKEGAKNVTSSVGTNGNISYVVDMGRKIGYEGGYLGTKAALNKVQIVIKKGTVDELVTGFPVK